MGVCAPFSLSLSVFLRADVARRSGSRTKETGENAEKELETEILFKELISIYEQNAPWNLICCLDVSAKMSLFKNPIETT